MTIKELSQELNVSEQALRSWCRRNGIRKESIEESKGKKPGYIIDFDIAEQIKNYYSTKGNETSLETKRNESQGNETKADELTKLQADINLLKAETANISINLKAQDDLNKQLTTELNTIKGDNTNLKVQLKAKEEINMHLQQSIAELTADKKKLNARLDKAEETISNLTVALTAAQALHGIDKKQAVIELTQEQEQSTQEPAEDTPKPKFSLFQRLFRKKK